MQKMHPAKFPAILELHPGFIAPTMQQELQQRRLVGIEPLERLALDARDNRCNEPLRLAHLEQSRLGKLAMTSEKGPHAMVRLIARVVGVGVETADMLVNEVFSRHLRDRKAVARYAGLTGSPDESGKRRRERGLARAGNARVRCGMIQLAWRFLRFQKDSALTQWFQARTADGRGSTRKTMIVALARKLLIALWRLVTMGELSDGIVLRPAS